MSQKPSPSQKEGEKLRYAKSVIVLRGKWNLELVINGRNVIITIMMSRTELTSYKLQFRRHQNLLEVSRPSGICIRLKCDWTKRSSCEHQRCHKLCWKLLRVEFIITKNRAESEDNGTINELALSLEAAK